MYIKNITVNNYKSYLTSPQLELRPGFNYVVGQNDAGKTALLEAFSLGFVNKPHRSLRTHPQRSSKTLGESSVTVEYHLNLRELLEAIGTVRNSGVFVPVGDADSEAITAAHAQGFIEAVANENTFKATYTPDRFVSGSLNGYSPDWQDELYFRQVVWTGQDFHVSGGRTTHPQDTLLNVLGRYLQSRTYVFRAERLKIGHAYFDAAIRLEPDASNLPVVINTLQGNPARFARLNEYMRRIFPHIHHISTVPRPDKNVELFVWPVGIGEREDLAIPVSESGTGIGQVLALLYVVLTSEDPQVIVIDEPQSFLHPGAARKLVELLGLHPQHQFILATHSPNVLSPVAPSTMTLVRKVGSESLFEILDVSEQQDLQRYLLEVGARLSDVFGADSILWVEGKTEELCYPLIIRNLLHRPLMGTAVLGVVNTGDFESKHATLVLNIYKRLSHGAGLLPPAIGFIFDGENKTPSDKDDLNRKGGGKIHFLPRRMYENYLLNPEGVCAVLNAAAKGALTDASSEVNESPISTDQVRDWLDENRRKPQYFAHSYAVESDPKLWIVHVDGARLLKQLFAELTDNTVTFNKVTHSIELTRWIIEHSPADLVEVSELLNTVLPETTR